MQLNVPFSEIPDQGVEFDIQDSSWFPDDVVEQAGAVGAHIRLTRKNDTSIELRGRMHAAVALECDRCLERFIFEVDSSMQMVISTSAQNEHWRLQDLESSGGDLETLSQDRPVVDLAEILRQQLLLALPEKKLCMENCAGLCPHCGTNLNEKDCGCADGASNSPFAVLSALKKK
ncbi:MAG: DUF177 domain-containing protein [Desulfobulbaceae bacterium]|nr:DUF177 domain-containing protein [Desulfobulbaceae bacterium]